MKQFSSVRITGLGTLYRGKISKAPMLALRSLRYYVLTGVGDKDIT